MVFEVNFSIQVEVNDEDLTATRKENRNFLSSGYFTKNENLAQVIAFNRGHELIVKHSPKVKVEVSPKLLDNIIDVK